MSTVEEYLAGQRVAAREQGDVDTLTRIYLAPFGGRNIKCAARDCTLRATRLLTALPCQCTVRYCVPHAQVVLLDTARFVTTNPPTAPARHDRCNTRFVVADWGFTVIPL